MSDSESDIDFLQNNVLSFQNQGTTVWAKGPNINNTNVSSLSFRSNMTSSNMPWNVMRPRYAESAYEQRSSSMYQNVSSLQPRNFHNSYYPSGMSSHRSMYNGRSGSPMSVRTMDSNASFSVQDIESAVKTGLFSKIDLQRIKNLCNKHLKGRIRKRAERKRNRRLKGFYRRSGGESGEQESESPMSSDDCRSIRTSKSTMYKENMSSCRSTRTDLSYFRKTMKESNLFQDCTDNFRQNSFRNTFAAGPANVGDNIQHKLQNTMFTSQQKLQNAQNASFASQKDRFKSGFLLPSQRFNQSIASSSIPENSESRPNRNKNITMKNIEGHQQMRRLDTDSEHEDIFTEVSRKSPTNSNHGKRVLDDENIPVSDQKRSKLSSPQKTVPKPKTPKQSLNMSKSMQKPNDFIFAKPQFPVPKSNIVKAPPKSKNKSISKTAKPQAKVPATQQQSVLEPIAKAIEQPGEKLISSSKQVAVKTSSKDRLLPKPVEEHKLQARKSPQNISQPKLVSPQPESSQLSTTDMSMRPSFIKRKLFTQKIDPVEKNSSSDSLQADSPQTNIYSKIQKEKNRARKLVTSQSCLNRDVLADDSNLLDLIHKVVPANQMNMTTSTHIQNNTTKITKADILDITSMTTLANSNGDVSDTYTDEEIFNDQVIEQQKKKTVNKKTRDKPNNSRENTSVSPEAAAKQKERKDCQKKDKVDNKKKDNVDNPKKDTVLQKKVISNEKRVTYNEKQVPQKQQIKQSFTCNASKVVLEKLPSKMLAEPATMTIVNNPSSHNENNGSSISYRIKCIKSFWDTDAESDFEGTPLKASFINITANKVNNNNIKLNADNSKPPAKMVKANADIISKPPPKLSKTEITADIIIKPPPKTSKSNAANDNSKPPPKVSKPSADINIKSPAKTSKPNSDKTVKHSIKTSKSNADNSLKQPSKVTKTNADKSLKSPTKAAKSSTGKNARQSPKTKANAKSLLNVKEKPNSGNKTIAPASHMTSQKRNTNSVQKKIIDKKNNNNTTLRNMESPLMRVHNNTFRIRVMRKPKINRCCDDPDRSEQSFNSSLEIMYRTLRSRKIDLSISLTPDEKNKSKITKKTTPKTKRGPAKNRNNLSKQTEIARNL